MTATARRRPRNATRGPKQASQPDGSLPLALNQLRDAVYSLCHRRPQQDSRYQELRDALTENSGAGHNAPHSTLPLWIDALKLAITIDNRTHQLSKGLPWPPVINNYPTVIRLKQIARYPKYRPQDTRMITNLATEITSWSIAVDDLFATKPKYLPDPCPQCRQTHTHRKTDDGETVRTPALAVTAERGCVCQACHATWPPDHLVLLGRVLGYTTQGLIA